MSPQQKRRPQARKGRTAAAARKGGRRTDRTALIAALLIVAVGVSLVIAFASNTGTKTKSTADAPASAALVAKVTGVSTAVSTQVGQGSAGPLPKKLPGPPLVDKTGKPRIVYIGAEYCPYCATERWAMVNAFSRFGTFRNLQITSSALSPEVYPGTNTFSFYKSSYTSPYITFETVETSTNTEKPLETPSSEQQSLQAKWDVPPYETQSGAIPFIDFANQLLISGATYNPTVLQGQSHDQIASAMNDPSSKISQGAVGAANVITASVCTVTHDKPANVCTDRIKAIETDIQNQK